VTQLWWPANLVVPPRRILSVVVGAEASKPPRTRLSRPPVVPSGAESVDRGGERGSSSVNTVPDHPVNLGVRTIAVAAGAADEGLTVRMKD
jgi:hypothetical protein